MKDRYDMFVDGRSVPAKGGGYFAVENPATGSVAAHVAEGKAEDVEWAIEAGRQAFDDGRWSRMEPRERARILNRAAQHMVAAADELAEIETISTGRPIREMRAQTQRVPEWLEYFAALIQASEGTVPPFAGPYLNYVRRMPLGVVGQLTPWNHPLLIAMKKIAPALAAGNSLVVKPSELAPIAVIELARLCAEAGVPDGVLNVVPGYGPTAGKALSESPRIAKLDLTGGTPTGRAIAAAAGRNLIRVTAELGGKAPVIVFDDADLTAAVNGATFAAFVATGQTCVQGARLLVQESIREQFTRGFVDKVRALKIGDPMDPSTEVGPVVSRNQLERVSGYVEGARRDGAEVLCGGTRPLNPNLQRGYFYEPTLVSSVTPAMTIVREEIFGPVTVILPFRDERDAIALANDSPFGLGAAVWTRDVKRAHRVAQSLQAGIVWINDHHRIDPSSPWGGFKESGIGRENGWEALHEYTQSQSIIVNLDPTPFDWYGSDGGQRYS